MNLNDIRNISLDDIYWRIKFGKVKKQLSVFDLRSDLNSYIQKPIFFLSTGRCGTKWFSDLFSEDKSLMVLHNPNPTLATQSKLVYDLSSGNIGEREKDLLKELFLTGRELYLRYAAKTKKSYIETNNYITFFAPILSEIFPDAKFVHVYRHPGEFVRSGIRRNYYTENNTDDIKRPIPGKDFRGWNVATRVEKVSWLWNETNQFVEEFKKVNRDKVFDFNFNELSDVKVKELLTFLDLDSSKLNLHKALNHKANTQKSGSFPKYNDWSAEQKRQLRDICNPLAEQYNYDL